MGAPITWRTVQGDSQAAAVSNIFEQSRVNLAGGLGALGGVLKDQEVVATRNMAALDEAAKQAYLDQLSGAKTPEQLAALQASGALDAARQGLSVQARAAVRGADEARTTALRTNLAAEQQFGIGQKDFADAPGREQVKALQAAGKFAEADALAAQLDLRVRSDLIAAGRTGARDQVLRDRTDTAYAQTLEDQAFSRPLTRAAALRGERIGVLGLADTEQAASDKTELRTLETALAGAAARNAADVSAMALKQGALAKQLGFPTNASGQADFANMNEAQIKLFDQGAKTMGVPPSTAAMSGDTEKADSYLRELGASGKFSPRVLRANENAIRGAFNSGAPAPVGNDAFNVALTAAKNQVGFDRSDANNWYAPNSPDARKSYEDLAKQIPDLVKGNSTGWDQAEDVEDVQSLIGEIGAVGIKRKDGTSVVPSANDVMRFVRASDGGLFLDSTRATNIRKKLEEWVNTPEAIKMSQDGLKSQSWRDKQRVMQILKDANNPAPKK